MNYAIIERYISELLEYSTPENPVWNIEKILKGKSPGWNYIDGFMIFTILTMYNFTKDRKYLEFADNFIDYYVFEDGRIRGYDPEEKNIDNIMEGRVLFKLYDYTDSAKYRKAIDSVYHQLTIQPRTAGGNFWHKNIYPHQVWLDGLYMAMPFYLEYGKRFNNRKGYDDIRKQFSEVHDKMRDSRTGIYFHGYDESKSIFWCDRKTGLSRNFWLRANGWLLIAMLDCLEVLDGEGCALYRFLEQMFSGLIESLLEYQGQNGLWFQVIDQAERAGNYPETSGSAIVAYALFKGVCIGLLSDRYLHAAEKAFAGISEMYLSEKNGRIQLGGICLGAGLGGNEKRDGSYEYYISEKTVENDAKGVAPFLLAYIYKRYVLKL